MVYDSNEMFINMRPSDIPPYNSGLSFHEQEKSTQEFFLEEYKKLRNGIVIDGVFVHPWLYWYLNFWYIFIDVKKGRLVDRVKSHPHLRDNEWFFAENYKRAEDEGKGVIMFGTRRFGKALGNNEVVYTSKGPLRICEIGIGDYIYDDSGSLVQVVGVYPQGFVNSYDIEFDDGRVLECCEDHLWEIEYHGLKKTIPLKDIVKFDYSSAYIPKNKPLKYPYVKNNIPCSPDAYSVMCAMNVLYGDDVFFSNEIAKKFLVCTEIQRRMFVESFIDCTKGLLSSGYIPVSENVNRDVLSFVLSMFRGYGYYAKDMGDRIFIDRDRKTSFKKITYKGVRKCTCIEVNNNSHLFLTTDYIVTHNSAILSSMIGYKATVMFNSENQVVGFSDYDLGHIGKYLEFGLNNVHPFFYINRPSSQWNKGVVLGSTSTDNKRAIHSYISIVNINMGKGQSTQNSAGATQTSYIMDEIGKGACIEPYLAARPGFSTPLGTRVNPILAGTGGNVNLSRDAQIMINNPEEYGLLLMDWDFLNKRAVNPTWKIRPSGMFVPGAMSHSEWCEKDETNLAKYLGKTASPGLSKIKMFETNFERSTKALKDHLNFLSKSSKKSAANSFRMFYPMDLDDCFMKESVNDFPIEAAVEHKNFLLETKDTGMLVDVFQSDNFVLGWKESDREPAPYPFGGGIIEAPVKIFEAPVSNDLRDYIYVAGLDPYKTVKARSSVSLGAFYVYKRMVGINDPFSNQIVASYVSRPHSIDAFCRVCEILQEGYGAVCLPENADIMYETYLRSRNKESALLALGDDISLRYNSSGRKQSNPYGLSPTGKNQELLIKLVVQYCNEKIVVGYNEDGEPIEKYGIVRIKDFELLEEIIDYSPDTNHDRIIAFGHALALAKYYDDSNMMPRTSYDKSMDEDLRKKNSSQLRRYSGYTNMLNRRRFK